MSGQLTRGTELQSDQELSCEVLIIGSGAGGAVLAAELCAAGRDVVMIEEGGWHTRRDFTLREADAYPMLYQDGGARATADLAISIMQGRSVGGSTTVNWTTCFRTPERILDHWAKHHGLGELSAAALAPHFEAMEARLSIAEWPEARANPNNRALLDGARALGWEAKALRRNVKGCADSGYCSMGCPVDGKQAMQVTCIQDALRDGLRLYSDTRAERIVLERSAVTAVEARSMIPRTVHAGPRSLHIRPKVVALCGGAINSPALLLRSGLDSGGLVGRRTFLHPVIAVVGEYDNEVAGYRGAPQSVGSHQFIDRGADKVGFFLESAPLHPMIATVATPAFGQRLGEFLPKLPHLGGLLGLHVDGLVEGDEGGTVSLRPDGRVKIDYPIRPALIEAMRASHEVLAQITLAAGAKAAYTNHKDPLILKSKADLPLLDTRAYGAHQHSIFTAHQMGGCRMGTEAKRSVVRPDHRHHDIGNLFVVDGSVLPTSLGVNPSETIYGLAHRAAGFIAAAV